MPIKKLVELNGEYGGWLEIDPVKLRRTATEFKAWLLKVNPNNDPYNFLKKDLPLVNSALDGSLKTPFNDFPHIWEMKEGKLPREYIRKSAEFYNTIAGALIEPPEVIQNNGKYYAWAEFEDK